MREKYSKNVGIWSGEAPQPNEVLHMWHYPSFEARAKTRAAAFQDKDWLGFVARNGDATNSLIALPMPNALVETRRR